MKVVCIVQARVGSTRLPGKVLKKICGKTVLEHVINRLKLVSNIDEIVIATTIGEKDNVIVDEAIRLGVKCFRGSENDVLSRYHFAAKESNADIVVRVTSDCPLLDSDVCRKVIDYLKNNSEYDYVSNTIKRSYPRGLDVEVFSVNAIERTYKEAKKDYEKEHVTPYIWQNEEKFKVAQIIDTIDNSNLRLTLDTKEDFELIKYIYENLYRDGQIFRLKEVLELYKKNPKIFEINREIEQKKIGE